MAIIKANITAQQSLSNLKKAQKHMSTSMEPGLGVARQQRQDDATA